MADDITVSILLARYENAEKLSCSLKGILSQKVEFPCEIWIRRDSNAVKNLETILKKFDFGSMTYKIYEADADNYGVTKAPGKYIAFCCQNDIWTDPYKLSKQVAFLEAHDDYTSCVHDIDVYDSYQRSYRFALQQNYKKIRFSPDKNCTWKQMENFLTPGALSTLVCRNIFNKEEIAAWVKRPHQNNKFSVFYALTLEGPCYNMHEDVMVKRHCKYPSHSYLPAYSYQEALREIQDLEAICEYGQENYNIHFDKRYRLIQIASMHFEHYKKGAKTADDLKNFLDIYELAYRPEYDRLTEDCHDCAHEKTFFEFLRGKIYWYQIRKGTAAEVKLLNRMYIPNDEVCVERMLQCYKYEGKGNRAVREILLEKAADAAQVKSTVRKRLVSAPFRKVGNKIKQFSKWLHKTFKRVVTYRLRQKGYSPYMANEWYDSVRINLLEDKETPLKDKLWSYKRGFMPWRLFQYGLTEDNYKQYLSDRDYMYLHQINNTYKKWIEDKMTFRYVLEPFKEYLPKYYYHIIRREGYPLILPLMDCPEGYEGTFDELLRLLRDKGALALKAASGTHGVGFYKMAYENGTYYMNNKESSAFEIHEIIRGFRNYYVVTEYITMHDEIKRLYGGSVNTIRMMMINRDGLHPQLLDAYMRIGSASTGTTDNVAFGGVFCRIDMETGHYSNPEQSKNHVLVECPYHPDTNEKIEGQIPHWELIKEKVIEMSKYMGPLEYLGFDIVCTPDGFIVLEINSHQDLHRYLYYDRRIKKFLFDKLEYKHKLYK